MLRDFLDRILELHDKPKIIVDEDRSYFTNSKPMAIRVENVTTKSLHTLDSVKRFIDAEPDNYNIFVKNFNYLEICGPLDEWNHRQIFAVAESDINIFSFGKYMDIEQFIVSVQCNFEKSSEKKEVLDFVSKIQTSEVTSSEDDGVAQTAVVKNTVGRMEKKEFNPMVELRPYRTFREIRQPKSTYLLRLTKTSSNKPQVALFPADGELWKIDAIKSIGEYLKSLSLSEDTNIIF